ncbi:recombinase family protein [Vibrio sp. FF145]|uniref:recombinase family protein n=1 Tax=Vibrio sp. FF145 TaxID=3230013 RepID=UPI00352D0245
MATVAYYRVSTDEQTIESQRHAIESVYNVERSFTDEGVSGTVAAMEREGFAACINYLREGDTFVVWDIDRLGRDSIDVQINVKELKERGVNIIIQTMGIDLTTEAGELLVVILSKVAEMERKKILARTKAGREAAIKAGKHMGAPIKFTPKMVMEQRDNGLSIKATAVVLGCSEATVKRLQKEAKAQEVSE